MTRWLVLLPFAAFAGALWVAQARLQPPSARGAQVLPVGRAIPELALPRAVAGKPGVDAAGFARGRPRLVNVFASWCVPCAAEAPRLMALKRAGVAIDAIAVRDTGAGVARFLKRNGDPYVRIGDDRLGRYQHAVGSSGVPETFVVDGRGRIAAWHPGEVRADDVAAILAAVEAAR